MPKPLLTFETLAPERPTIAIDGAAYELAAPEDFGIMDQARLSRLQKRVNEFAGGADISDEDAAMLVDALDQLVILILPSLPADVRGRLRDGHKLQIIQAFSQAAGIVVAATTPRPPKRTGANTSRGSNGSTAAVPPAG